MASTPDLKLFGLAPKLSTNRIARFSSALGLKTGHRSRRGRDPLQHGPAAATEAGPFEKCTTVVHPDWPKPVEAGPTAVGTSIALAALFAHGVCLLRRTLRIVHRRHSGRPPDRAPASLLCRPSYCPRSHAPTLPPPVPANACSPPALSFHLSYVTSRALLTPIWFDPVLRIPVWPAPHQLPSNYIALPCSDVQQSSVGLHTSGRALILCLCVLCFITCVMLVFPCLGFPLGFIGVHRDSLDCSVSWLWGLRGCWKVLAAGCGEGDSRGWDQEVFVNVEVVWEILGLSGGICKGGFTIEPVRPHKRRRKSRTGMDVDPRQYEDMVRSMNHSFVCLSLCLSVTEWSRGFNHQQCSNSCIAFVSTRRLSLSGLWFFFRQLASSWVRVCLRFFEGAVHRSVTEFLFMLFSSFVWVYYRSLEWFCSHCICQMQSIFARESLNQRASAS